MAENGYCPYCGSANIVRYKNIAWKCNECGKLFGNPLVATTNETTNTDEVVLFVKV